MQKEPFLYCIRVLIEEAAFPVLGKNTIWTFMVFKSGLSNKGLSGKGWGLRGLKKGLKSGLGNKSCLP